MATLTADSKGRITLGPKFAGKTLRIEEIDEFELRAQVVEVIPAREAWLWKNKTALRAVRDGLNQAARGELVKGPNLDADAKLVAKLKD